MHKFLIVGDGRVAQHMSQYFELLQIPFARWSRQHGTQISHNLNDCTNVLVLIKDDAIVPFLQEHSELQNKTCVHFSGSLVTELAHGCHPLTSFSSELYSLETYRSIHFICEAEGPAGEVLLPGLPNSFWRIPRADKPFYHALCVMSGNFSTILWSKLFSEMEQRWDLPRSVAFPYLQQVTQNLERQGERALTGPLIRGDWQTIEANLASLENDRFQKVYAAFVEAYRRNP